MILNFEYKKLVIENPDMVNTVFLFMVLLCLLFCNIRKADSSFLNIDQTNQAKGVAILLIILGHFWVHITSAKPVFVLSGDGVSLFFLLSGFGLIRSYQRGGAKGKDFFLKRFKRIFIPYWTATLIILVLDYVLLDQQLSWANFMQTMTGVNINEETRHIDYARWFITFLLFWYIFFYISTLFRRPLYSLIILFMVAGIGLILDYYVFHFGWYQFFAFPIGCLIGVNFACIQKWVHERYKMVFPILFCCFAATFLYYGLFSRTILSHFPYLFNMLANEAVSIVFSLGVLLWFSFFGLYMKVNFIFSFLGTISYELFLIHGPFLVKYNPFITSGNLYGGISLYLISILMISYLFKKVILAFERKIF